MNQSFTPFATFGVERIINAAPDQVFLAWSKPSLKARWFVGPRGQWKEKIRESNFRVGGRERLIGSWSDGRVTTFDCRYLEIIANERIAYSYEMFIDKTRISMSLANVQLTPSGASTRLRYHEHAVFLNGFADNGGREQGTRALLDQLESVLRVKPMC